MKISILKYFELNISILSNLHIEGLQVNIVILVNLPEVVVALVLSREILDFPFAEVLDMTIARCNGAPVSSVLVVDGVDVACEIGKALEGLVAA